jgi:GNAT superfamily N-acetyltransferase
MYAKVTKTKKFSNLFKYGLVLEAFVQRLKRIGVEINAMHFIQEHLREDLGPAFDARFKDYDVVALKPEDMETIASVRGWRDADHYKSELASGKLCFGVKVDNQLAGFTWANLKECKYSGIIRPLKGKGAYLYDAYTFPAFRGRGIAPFVRYQCYKALDQMGIKTLYSVSSYFNKPAIVFKQKLGATFLRIEIQIKLFNKFKWLIIKKHKN